jgi:phage tail sheath protein FI
MPVAPTYPGVYIEEIPSGVHTLTGVATSITAFLGYTVRGRTNTAVRIKSFADFERSFGGLTVDSVLSYSVKQFFQNGGSDAYIIRVATGARRASVAVMTEAGGPSLVISANGEGTWGNLVRVDVDYGSANPTSLFNITVTEYVDRDGALGVGRVESFRNLSMNSFDAAPVIATVNAASELVTVALGAFAFGGNGTSVSAELARTDLARVDPTNSRIAFSLNGDPAFEFDLVTAATPLQTAVADWPDTTLDDVATRIQTAIDGLHGAGSVVVSHNAGDAFITATAQNDGSAAQAERSSIHFLTASRNDGTALLGLGLANGGVETDAAAAFRPAATGTVGAELGDLSALTLPGSLTITARRGAATLGSVDLPIWGAGTPLAAAPDTRDEVLGAIRAALRGRTGILTGATAWLAGNRLRIVPGPIEPAARYVITDTAAGTTVTELGLTGAGSFSNVGAYALGSPIVDGAQGASVSGTNGTPPGANEFRGSPGAKTGIYALEDVDLFNILCLPDVESVDVLGEALAYAVRRRAFMIFDLPKAIDTPAEAVTWMNASAGPLRNRNAAAYFPRLRESDPLANGVVKPYPACGAMAGIYARTDTERGVWKAPAGTNALVNGAAGLTATMTDGENGDLNPLGLNCIRTFPVYGTVVWGARTMRGADALTDEYKYVPVRRLALFLEESLYRGTQWVVFEPNDEPLWAQIRLNVGAFMHSLFNQGAFQGKTAREAYFVRCDAETTTQNDIDLGRVNILVGFAPLKPAEFVVIRIQQIARGIQV